MPGQRGKGGSVQSKPSGEGACSLQAAPTPCSLIGPGQEANVDVETQLSHTAAAVPFKPTTAVNSHPDHGGGRPESQWQWAGRGQCTCRAPLQRVMAATQGAVRAGGGSGRATGTTGQLGGA